MTPISVVKNYKFHLLLTSIVNCIYIYLNSRTLLTLTMREYFASLQTVLELVFGAVESTDPTALVMMVTQVWDQTVLLLEVQVAVVGVNLEPW